MTKNSFKNFVSLSLAKIRCACKTGTQLFFRPSTIQYGVRILCVYYCDFGRLVEPTIKLCKSKKVDKKER